ncbi:Probable plastid-lipid-associated protein 11 [Striga hermonthica]|uniref:Probable plastid-lipid-associated protein 11 n=1 Tax=Striga hermonthica TaxID=68872 RepID=A0A9N7N9T2_STRHE|nr:Probable plastid-lipid-associated protein 11 [Striga hermonthica]
MAANSLSLPAISNFSLPPKRSARVTRLSLTDQSQSLSVDAKRHLLRLIADQDRGLKTQSDTQRLSHIIEAVDSLAATSRGASPLKNRFQTRGGCCGPQRRSNSSS